MDNRTDGQRQAVSQVHLPRRLKACIHCREQKLRCKRNNERPKEGCERCLSARRQCVVPEPVKRRKPKLPRKNGSSVADLESKLDALVATLEERRGVNHGRHPSSIELQFQDATNKPPQNIHTASKTTKHSPGASNSDQAARRRPLSGENQHSYSFFLRKTPKAADVILNDVISKGMLSLEEAEQTFTRFTESMLPYFPVIVFPPGATVSDLRSTKPALLLAILGAASNFLGKSVQKALITEVMKNYADRIVVRGNKDLDLVQAIQVTILWYFPPDHFHEVKVYQFIQMAATMAIELDFAQPNRLSGSRLLMLKNMKPDQPLPENPLLETPKRDEQRALLTCYVLSTLVSMLTRRPSIMRWNHHIDICVKALESPTQPSINDMFLCQWVKAQHIVEEISLQFFMDDHSANLDVSDLSVRYVLRSLEQQFEQFKANIPPQIPAINLQIEVNIINLYMHEIFLHASHSINGSKLPSTEESISDIRTGPRFQASDPTRQRALAICIISVKNALNNFLSLDVETLCFVPVFTYVRVAYVVFAMMKIYFAMNMGDGDPEAMLNDDGLDVEFYLDALLNSMDRLAQMKNLRFASLFRLMLLMLRTWFRKQQSSRNPSDTLALGMHKNDSMLQTVLDTAEGIGANTQHGSGRNLIPQEKNIGTNNVATVNNSVLEEGSRDNLPFVVERWASGLEGAPLSDEIDLASLFENDDSMLLQAAMEWLGGLID